MTYGSVCSGIDAANVAFDPLGWRCAFVSEIEPFARAVHAQHHPRVPDYGDMTQHEQWPPTQLDVLIGGTPCQSFSFAGLRKGMADPRGNLALTFLAVVDQFAPTWVVWENVPGVHSSWSDASAGAPSEAARKLLAADGLAAGDFEEVEQTNDFDCFLSGLEELGYGVATRILDAQYFGLAQRRARVFVIGHIGGQWQRAAAVLFERGGLCGHPAPRRQTGEGTAPSLAARTSGGGGLGTDADCGGAVIPIQEIGKRAAGDEVANIIPEVTAPLKAETPSRRNGGSSPIAEEFVAFDTTQITSPMAVRRLTPRECERLQGFPDDYTLVTYRGKPACDGPRYRALGNSFPVPVIRWLGERIELVEELVPITGGTRCATTALR